MIATALLLIMLAAAGDDPPGPDEPAREIPVSVPTDDAVDTADTGRRAVERGVRFLLDRQLVDGSWAGWAAQYKGGVSALVTFALLRSGVAPTHPAIVRALAYLEHQVPEHTYSAGSLLMALGAAGDREHLPWMRRTTAWLLEQMPSSGLYAYPDRHEDLSNSLFVAIGLDLVADRGVKVPVSAWKDLIRGAMSCHAEAERARDEAGGAVTRTGFSYRPNTAASGSMAAAGITILEICRRRLDGKLPARQDDATRRAQRDALAWLAANFTVNKNPPNRSWHFFHLWGYERVGAFLGIREIGSHDWYDEGAAFLVKHQKKAGNWYADIDASEYDKGSEEMAELRTAVALLFLRRASAATSSRDAPAHVYATAERKDGLRLRAAGDTPLRLWVEKPPAGTLRVDYHALRDGDDESAWFAGSDQADESFAVRHEFARSGSWQIWCEIDAGVASLTSDRLEVSIDKVLEPEYVEHATDATRNVLADGKKEVESSSDAKDAERAELAFDNLQGTFWRCDADDAEPWIRARLDKPVVANRVLLTCAMPRRASRDALRTAAARVTLNGRHRYEVEMPRDPDRKAILDLPRRARIQSVQVELVAARGAEIGSASIGIAEVELQLRRD